MQKTKRTFGYEVIFSGLSLIVILLGASFPTRCMAQQKGQRTFPSPEDAASAFFAAAQSNDEMAMLDILGPDGKEIIASGDAVQDKANRADFVRRYQQMHRFVKEPDGKTMMYIGAENWPCPIPLVSKRNAWFYDTDAGKKEILYRRIGRNEMSAIHICRELIAAQKEYHSSHNNEYAQKIFSDDRQQNGLYWEAADGEPESPIGPEVARARADGYTKTRDSQPIPYRGYFFHILTSQGKDAVGGPQSYIVGGKMVNGAAFIAFPAEYRSSGVMTFIVGLDGVVYEMDLGKNTAKLANATKEFNPAPGWHKVEMPQEETAGKN